MVTIMDGGVYVFFLATTLIILFSLETSIKRLERRMKRIDYALGLILNRMEIEIPSQLSERVKQIALDPSRKIEAIKIYREENRSSLLEAKEAIENFIERNQN
ncbi:hypothetical protein [Pseudanabaena sp. UWO310]|uniref:hypothetical protein n=1 Tax=Pseudanabaena sp. UWO310 TaxID=2480795 RepID=UPI0011610741|nr:hypothetical protein [Pseudanabaena sp. UWO310]TYQ23431.1 hypothetical protein PseudUWO310_22320 [Pseudanabaena sp. UWO310]